MRRLWQRANWSKVPRAVVDAASRVWGWLRARWPSARERLRGWAHGLWTRLRVHFGDPENDVVWGIVILAAALRLGHLDLIPFGAEQAGWLVRGLRIVDQLLLPLVGARSADGLAEPPGMSWVVAFPLLVGRDPRVISTFLSLLNVGAVLGCYRLARRHYGLIPAIVSATLFAVNPWAVLVSREISVYSVMPPLAVLLLYGLCAGILERRPWGWALACATLGLALNLTLSCLPLVLVLALVMALYRRRVRWPEACVGLCLAAITSIPYLYYQYTHGFRDLRALLSGWSQGGGAVAAALRALTLAGRVHSGRGMVSLAGASASQYLPAPGPLHLLDALASWAFLASLAGLVALATRAWSHWKERQDPARYLVLAVWLGVPILAVPSRAIRLATHGLVFLYPAGFLAVGVVLDWVLGKVRGRGPWQLLARIGAGLGVLLVVGWQAYSVVYLHGFVVDHDTAGGYGVPYRYWRRTVEMVRRQVEAVGADEVWVVAQGSDVSRDEQPMVLHYLLEPEIRARFLGQGRAEALLLPAAQPGVYLLTRESPRVEQIVDILNGQPRGLVIFPGQEIRARVEVAESCAAKEILDLVPSRSFEVLDSGACLLGCDWPSEAAPGQTITFASYWTFIDIPDQERQVHHSLFNHLHASTGPLVAQCYGFGLPDRYWSPGLVLVQWFEMPLPADLPEGDYALLTGMYRLSDLTRNRILDDLGSDLGDAIRLGSLWVSEGSTE